MGIAQLFEEAYAAVRGKRAVIRTTLPTSVDGVNMREKEKDAKASFLLGLIGLNIYCPVN